MWRSLVLGLACAGCTNPDDILMAHGTVVSVDPVEGQVVRLLRYLSPQNPFGGGDLCSLASPLREERAGVEGEFSFEVFRVETRSVPCFRVDAHFPSGSVAWSDFSLFGSQTQLPPLRDWRADPWLDGGVLHFNPPVPWPDELPSGIQLTHREQLLTADGGLAWQAEDRGQLPDASVYPYAFAREPLVMDALRLEDFEGTLSLSASLLDQDQERPLISWGAYAARMRAGQRLALRGTRVPLSRGLACPELATPCPLTDGELTEVDAGLIDQVSLNLATPAMVSAVVFRGAWVPHELIRVVLEQDDGGIGGEFEGIVPRTDFSPFGPGGGSQHVRLPDGGFGELRLSYLVIPLDAGTASSRVTLQFPAGLARIQEVSVFEQ